MAFHAPFGNDETPAFFTKIIGGRTIAFVRCHSNKQQRLYDNIDIRHFPQYRYAQRDFSQFYGFDRKYAAMRNGGVYHTVAPWEYGEGGQVVKPTKKMFPRDQFVVRNQDLSPREIRQVLPPIGVSISLKEEEKRLLRGALNGIFARQGMKSIDDLKNGLLMMDIRHEGILPAHKVLGLMKQRQILLDQGLTKVLTRTFAKPGTDKLFYLELISFFRSACTDGKRDEKKKQSHDNVSHKLDNQWRDDSMLTTKPNHILPNGRHYIQPTSVSVPARTEVKRAAMARRDKSLLNEMEKSLKGYRGDANYLIDQFKSNLARQKAQDRIVTTYQLKSMAIRHQLPFNNALMDKLFDRLDPTGTGNVYWQEFTDFLERALPLNGNQSQKPPWETKMPLKAIGGSEDAAAQKKTKVEEQYNHKTQSEMVEENKKRQQVQKRMKESEDSSDTLTSKRQDTRRPESRLEKYILLIKDLRKRADPKTNLLDAEEARRLLQSYEVMFQLGMPAQVIDEIIERSDFDGTVDIDDVIGYLGGQ